jgi:hypothetical protein
MATSALFGVDLDAQEIFIDFYGRSVTYEFGELDEVSPAYATTIHKAQGSEYPAGMNKSLNRKERLYRCEGTVLRI